MTATALAGDRERILRSGMDDYVIKPVKLEDMNRALLRAWIEIRRQGPAMWPWRCRNLMGALVPSPWSSLDPTLRLIGTFALTPTVIAVSINALKMTKCA